MATTSVPAAATYRFDRPTLGVVLADMRPPRSDEPGPGDPIPAVVLETPTGDRIDNASLRADGRPVLLVFGSRTCPVTESAVPGLSDLHALYGNAVRFLMVNVREAHPGESVSQPTTVEEKRRHATALARHHRLPFEVLVDDLDGATHRAFGPRPSSAYLIDSDGTILFRAQWSNVTGPIEEALADVTAGRPPRSADVRQTIRAAATMTGYAGAAFRSAGRGAMRDTWRAAAPLAAMITLSKVFNFLPAARRGWPSMALLAGLMAAIAVVIIGSPII